MLLSTLIAAVSSTRAPNATVRPRSRSLSSTGLPGSAGNENMMRIAVRRVPRKPTAVRSTPASEMTLEALRPSVVISFAPSIAPVTSVVVPGGVYAIRLGTNRLRAANTCACRSAFPASTNPNTEKANQSPAASAKNAWYVMPEAISGPLSPL